MGCLAVHAQQELFVVFGILHLGFYEIECLYGVHVGQNLAQDPHAVQGLSVLQQVVATGAGGRDIDGREHTLVGQVTVELQLHVTRTLELLEDDLIHLAARINQGGSDDGQRAASFDVTCSTEETFGLVQGVGIHTT